MPITCKPQKPWHNPWLCEVYHLAKKTEIKQVQYIMISNSKCCARAGEQAQRGTSEGNWVSWDLKGRQELARQRRERRRFQEEATTDREAREEGASGVRGAEKLKWTRGQRPKLETVGRSLTRWNLVGHGKDVQFLPVLMRSHWGVLRIIILNLCFYKITLAAVWRMNKWGNRKTKRKQLHQPKGEGVTWTGLDATKREGRGRIQDIFGRQNQQDKKMDSLHMKKVSKRHPGSVAWTTEWMGVQHVY